jgi:hypothetical protein
MKRIQYELDRVRVREKEHHIIALSLTLQLLLILHDPKHQKHLLFSLQPFECVICYIQYSKYQYNAKQYNLCNNKVSLNKKKDIVDMRPMH